MTVCVAEVWQECFGKDGGSMKRMEANEIRTILRQMPGWKETTKKQKCGPYGVQRCFERVDP